MAVLREKEKFLLRDHLGRSLIRNALKTLGKAFRLGGEDSEKGNKSVPLKGKLLELILRALECQKCAV